MCEVKDLQKAVAEAQKALLVTQKEQLKTQEDVKRIDACRLSFLGSIDELKEEISDHRTEMAIYRELKENGRFLKKFAGWIRSFILYLGGLAAALYAMILLKSTPFVQSILEILK